jgi:hypothetical protein
MPDRGTVTRWLEANEGFRSQYARARDLQHDYWAEEILALADTPQLGVRREYGTGAQGPVDKTVEADMIEHRRLQVDARKWLLSKLAPKKYGERVVHDVNLRVAANEMSDDELARIATDRPALSAPPD